MRIKRQGSKRDHGEKVLVRTREDSDTLAQHPRHQVTWDPERKRLEITCDGKPEGSTVHRYNIQFTVGEIAQIIEEVTMGDPEHPERTELAIVAKGKAMASFLRAVVDNSHKYGFGALKPPSA